MNRVACLLLVSACVLSATDWYASPTGVSTNNGSIASPWDFETGCKDRNVVQPGDTLWVRGGTYDGRFTCDLDGTNGSPITVRAYPGETPVFTGASTSITLTAATGTATAVTFDTISVSTTVGIPIGADIEWNDGLNEVMDVVSKTATTLTVTRGWNGSCPSGTCPDHASGTTIDLAGSHILFVNGQYIHFIGLMWNYPQVENRLGAGFNPPYPMFAMGLEEQCTGCKFINNTWRSAAANGCIHSGHLSTGPEYYGNVVTNCGTDDGADGSGHGFYIQNVQGGATKTISNNISFLNFGFNMQFYGDSAYVDNMTVTDNVLWNSGGAKRTNTYNLQTIYGATGSNGLIYSGNMSYFNTTVTTSGELRLGETGTTKCGTATITNNYLVGRNLALVVHCTSPTVTGNTTYGTVTNVPSGTNTNFGGTRPTGTQIFVKPNTYEPGRSHVVIYNWDNLDSVNLSQSNMTTAGIAIGDYYELWDVQNLGGSPLMTGQYAGGNLSVSMTSTTVTPITGNVSVAHTHTPKEFQAFLLRRRQVYRAGTEVSGGKEFPSGTYSLQWGYANAAGTPVWDQGPRVSSGTCGGGVTCRGTIPQSIGRAYVRWLNGSGVPVSPASQLVSH
jgi:hypothetical protein